MMQTENFIVETDGTTIHKIYLKKEPNVMFDNRYGLSFISIQEIVFSECDGKLIVETEPKHEFRIEFSRINDRLVKEYIDVPKYGTRETENFRILFFKHHTKIEYKNPVTLPGRLPFVIDSCKTYFLVSLDTPPIVYEIKEEIIDPLEDDGYALCIDMRKSEKIPKMYIFRRYRSMLQLSEEIFFEGNKIVKNITYNNNQTTVCAFNNGFVKNITVSEGLRELSNRKVMRPFRCCG